MCTIERNMLDPMPMYDRFFFKISFKLNKIEFLLLFYISLQFIFFSNLLLLLLLLALLRNLGRLHSHRRCRCRRRHPHRLPL